MILILQEEVVKIEFLIYQPLKIHSFILPLKFGFTVFTNFSNFIIGQSCIFLKHVFSVFSITF